jgi:hypothetical protein
MNCRHVWNREFLDTHLTRSWIDGDYKRHREAVLFDREKSLLPASQEAVEVERERRRLTEKRATLRERRKEIKRELAELDGRLGDIEYYEQHGSWRPVTGTTGTNPKKEARQFVAACPSATCRGFLNTAYICGVCEGKFCASCREPKADDHTCDPDLVATIKAITADSRACPSCGTAISRVSGCDQMYCTQCDTAFSYTTGKVVEGVIHNPHYFERLAKLKKDGADTGTAAGTCDRNGWPNWYRRIHYTASVTHLAKKGYTANLQSLYRIGVHIQDVTLPAYPQPDQLPNNIDLRIRYLNGEIDEHRFRQLLQRHDRTRARELEIREPLELAVVTILEFFVWLIHRDQQKNDEETKGRLEARLKETREFLETHVNAPLRSIGDRYGNAVPQLTYLDAVVGLEIYGYKPVATAARPRSKAVTTPPEMEGSVIEHH